MVQEVVCNALQAFARFVQLKKTDNGWPQRLVRHAASSAENIQQAKAGAEAAIRGVFGEVGWSVAVVWGPARRRQ